jgi:hypothetical protein
MLWPSRKNMQTSRQADLFRRRVMPQTKGYFQTLVTTRHITSYHILETKVQFYVDYHKISNHIKVYLKIILRPVGFCLSRQHPAHV